MYLGLADSLSLTAEGAGVHDSYGDQATETKILPRLFESGMAVDPKLSSARELCALSFKYGFR